MALAAGCASSELVDIWTDTSYQTASLNRILVISVTKDEWQRRSWEESFSAELMKHSVTAVPSSRLFSDALPDSEQVLHAVQSRSFDGVLIIRRLPVETSTHYVPAYVTREKVMKYYPNTDRLMTYYATIHHSAHIDSEQVDIRVIDLWATRDEGQIIWSATSRTPEPNSVRVVRPQIVDLVLIELTKQRIVASGR